MTRDEQIAAIRARLERLDSELAAMQDAHEARSKRRVAWYVLRLTSTIRPDGSAPGLSIFADWPPHKTV